MIARECKCRTSLLCLVAVIVGIHALKKRALNESLPPLYIVFHSARMIRKQTHKAKWIVRKLLLLCVVNDHSRMSSQHLNKHLLKPFPPGQFIDSRPNVLCWMSGASVIYLPVPVSYSCCALRPCEWIQFFCTCSLFLYCIVLARQQQGQHQDSDYSVDSLVETLITLLQRWIRQAQQLCSEDLGYAVR